MNITKKLILISINLVPVINLESFERPEHNYKVSSILNGQSKKIFRLSWTISKCVTKIGENNNHL